MIGDNIAERLLDFAGEALEAIGHFPSTTVANHIGRQLTRSATSGGANYEEARGAESTAEFAHKADIAAKEIRESVYWLRLADRGRLFNKGRLERLISEGRQLAAILRASGKTARQRHAGGSRS